MKIVEMTSIDSIRQNYLNNSGYAQALSRFEDIMVNKLGKTPYTDHSSIFAEGLHSNMKAVEGQALGSKLNQTGVFRADGQFDVRSGSGDSVEKINAFLKGTPMEGMGELFKHAEKRFGVNAYFLTGIAVLESNYGRSAIARDKKNLFGFGAYDDDPYGHAHSYHSFGESVIKVADYLNKNYLTEGGAYYKGTTTADVGMNYALDKKWSEKINRVIKNIMEG